MQKNTMHATEGSAEWLQKRARYEWCATLLTALSSSEPVILLFAQRDHGEASLADQRRASKQLTGFYLRQRHGMGDELTGFDSDFGNFGISSIYRLNRGGADCAFLVA